MRWLSVRKGFIILSDNGNAASATITCGIGLFLPGKHLSSGNFNVFRPTAVAKELY
jgi:hypothetical protein